LRDAYQSGQVNGIGSVPHTQFLETVRQVNGRLISNPIPRYTTLLFNFDESGNAQLKTRDMRLALAQGLDRQQIIDDSLAGQAIIFDGPYLPTSSAFAPEIATPIATNVVSATTVLNNLGWVLLDGASVRQNSDERLVLRLVGLEADRAVVTAVADQWTGLGIEIAIALEPNIEALRATLGNGEFDVALVDIAPSYDPDLYDFWSQEAIVRGQNYGKWNNRRASEALENGRQVWNREQRHAYYDTFIRIYDVELPALTLYQQINTVLISEDIQAVNLGIIQTPRDHYRNFPQWFVNVEEQDVPCN
jgi:peptide/nickel transport system substrate-binding protein